MPFNLADVLPHLLPKAIEWAEARSAEALANGTALTETGLKLAAAVGVREPGRVRVLEVADMPLPEDPELNDAALATGLLGPHMAGLTLGYGIFVSQGFATNRLISHECRHVFQYEEAGSIRDYLPVYLAQIAEFGYADAPYEVDARKHEREA